MLFLISELFAEGVESYSLIPRPKITPPTTLQNLLRYSVFFILTKNLANQLKLSHSYYYLSASPVSLLSV